MNVSGQEHRQHALCAWHAGDRSTASKRLHSSALWILCSSVALVAVSGTSAEPLRVSGLVVPYRQVQVASRADAVIMQVLVEEGSEVTQGQVLAKLDSQREELEAEYYKLLMEKRTSESAAARTLYDEKILSKDQWEQKQLDSQLAEVQYKLTQQRLEEKLIRAPLSGLLVRRYKERGESIERLQRFADIVSLEKIYVTVYFEPTEILRVKRGQAAEVRIPVCQDEPLPGFVETVDPVIDPASGMFRAKIVVDNRDGRIRTGTKAEVVLPEEVPHASAAQ